MRASGASAEVGGCICDPQRPTERSEGDVFAVRRSAVSGQRSADLRPIADPLPTQAVSREASRVGI